MKTHLQKGFNLTQWKSGLFVFASSLTITVNAISADIYNTYTNAGKYRDATTGLCKPESVQKKTPEGTPFCLDWVDTQSVPRTPIRSEFTPMPPAQCCTQRPGTPVPASPQTSATIVQPGSVPVVNGQQIIAPVHPIPAPALLSPVPAPSVVPVPTAAGVSSAANSFTRCGGHSIRADGHVRGCSDSQPVPALGAVSSVPETRPVTSTLVAYSLNQILEEKLSISTPADSDGWNSVWLKEEPFARTGTTSNQNTRVYAALREVPISQVTQYPGLCEGNCTGREWRFVHSPLGNTEAPLAIAYGSLAIFPENSNSSARLCYRNFQVSAPSYGPIKSGSTVVSRDSAECVISFKLRNNEDNKETSYSESFVLSQLNVFVGRNSGIKMNQSEWIEWFNKNVCTKRTEKLIQVLDQRHIPLCPQEAILKKEKNT